MDIVYIQDLGIETVIGVYDWERECRQTVRLSLEMASDIRAAAAQEDLSQTLDYHAIAERLSAFVQASEFQLIETLAEEVAALLMREFGVRWLRLQVSKPGAVPAARDVGVRIERGEKP
ncbi:MAG: dihydroneopterin aldolase [Pseudomonadales bacterium]|nr:dihydroneopterin aldolase [Pseudomonadales bacterium]MCP5329567.1 dihydroneopterin aldolase [Pseudomonadales bacterium]MCP5343894.1 dihydroneopterin aldolase [Pseudomonadales bacterium]